MRMQMSISNLKISSRTRPSQTLWGVGDLVDDMRRSLILNPIGHVDAAINSPVDVAPINL